MNRPDFENSFRKCALAINAFYLAGVLDYIKKNHYAVWYKLDVTERRIGTLWLDKKVIYGEFCEWLHAWGRLWKSAVKIFEDYKKIQFLDQEWL